MFLSVFHIGITSSYLIQPEIPICEMEHHHRQVPHCLCASCAAVELSYTSVIPSSLTPCPTSLYIPCEIDHFLTQNVKTAIFIKIYHATCNRFCRVIASPGGYCQSSLSLLSAGMGRSFGNQSLHPGRFLRLRGLLRVTHCPVPA